MTSILPFVQNENLEFPQLVLFNDANLMLLNQKVTVMSKRRWLLLIAFSLVTLFLVWQFSPPHIPSPPDEYRPKIVVWMGVTWSMDAYTDEELQSLASDWQSQGVDEAYIYVSYLKVGDFFNATYDHAADFTRRMKTYAPDVRLMAWVGVPISIIQPDGTYVSNRLSDPYIRQLIAEFAEQTITEMGFDGVHLNAELIPDGDQAYLQTLDEIREILPEGAILSTTSHALRVNQSVTFTPYPVMMHHATPEFLLQISQRVDQVALMAYDSGLSFPADYRSWLAYQVLTSAELLGGVDVELLIGLPTSEEWTTSHQYQAEYLRNALHGFYTGLNALDRPQTVAGIALYPYWETGTDEWGILREVSGKTR